MECHARGSGESVYLWWLSGLGSNTSRRVRGSGAFWQAEGLKGRVSAPRQRVTVFRCLLLNGLPRPIGKTPGLGVRHKAPLSRYADTFHPGPAPERALFDEKHAGRLAIP